MNNQTKENTRLTQALHFASQGIRVIPLHPNSKKPIPFDWPNKASADHHQIGQWFEQYPDCNYGLLMGEGFAVLDIDRKKGKNGLESLKAVDGALPLITLTVLTPSDGYHAYYHCKNALPKRQGFLLGVDFQAKGSYVVGPGSIIGGCSYILIDPAREIAEIPQWLIDATAKKIQHPKAAQGVFIEERGSFDGDAYGALGHLLEGINPDLEYGYWIEVLFAGINVFGHSEETVTALRDWSSSGQKFEEEAFAKAIGSHDPYREQQVGLPRLKEIARIWPRSDSWLPFHDEAIDLEQRVLNTSIDMLEKHGNKPSEQHLQGIKAIVQAMTHGLFENDRKFRKAFPLETGMGKTTCVVALVKELQHTDKSLLISAERIEQLIEMRDQMIEAGVDANKLGIFHSSQQKHPDCPTVKPADLDRVQFLLASHNRVKSDSMRSITERLMLYGQGNRDLVIWDETLLTTKADSLERASLRKAVSDWLIDYDEKRKQGRHSIGYENLYVEFRDFLNDVQEKLANKDLDNETLFRFPMLSCDPREYDKVINTWNGKDQQSAKILKDLVAYTLGGDIRIVKTSGGHTLVQFFQTVDDACDKMVILDASARIRDLLSYDPTVSVYPIHVSKDYSTVSINYSDYRGSKSSFDENPDHLTSYLGELDHLLGNVIPTHEPLLICCLKDLRDDIRPRRPPKIPQ